MRFLLALLGLAAVVVVVLVATGLLSFNTSAGSLPTVSVNGGRAPEVHANMATVEFGTKEKVIHVPTLSVNKPANETSTANAQ